VAEAGQAVLEQTRDNNKANEITEIDEITGPEWVTPEWDARGNMLNGPVPGDEDTRQHYKWDAWNRMVAVYADDEGEAGDLIATYRYDGNRRRIAKLLGANPENPTATYDYYYSGRQVVEVRKDGSENPYEQYVWGVRYVHSPVLRWWDENADGQDIETHYYTNDANFNVTALVETDGDVIERYVYDPYGQRTIYDDDWSETVDWEDSKKNAILFTGHRLDPETGLYSIRHRYYYSTRLRPELTRTS